VGFCFLPTVFGWARRFRASDARWQRGKRGLRRPAAVLFLRYSPAAESPGGLGRGAGVRGKTSGPFACSFEWGRDGLGASFFRGGPRLFWGGLGKWAWPGRCTGNSELGRGTWGLLPLTDGGVASTGTTFGPAWPSSTEKGAAGCRAKWSDEQISHPPRSTGDRRFGWAEISLGGAWAREKSNCFW